jgi:hypothetical protein
MTDFFLLHVASPSEKRQQALSNVCCLDLLNCARCNGCVSVIF